jgi:hypothetical protein
MGEEELARGQISHACGGGAHAAAAVRWREPASSASMLFSDHRSSPPLPTPPPPPLPQGGAERPLTTASFPAGVRSPLSWRASLLPAGAQPPPSERAASSFSRAQPTLSHPSPTQMPSRREDVQICIFSPAQEECLVVCLLRWRAFRHSGEREVKMLLPPAIRLGLNER